MAVLGIGEAEVEVDDLFALFGFRHGAVEVSSVDLVLTEAFVALHIVGGDGCGGLIGHRHPRVGAPWAGGFDRCGRGVFAS